MRCVARTRPNPQGNSMPSYPGVKANRSRGETFQDGWSANLTPQKLSSEGFIYTEISTSSCLVIAGILLTVFSMVPGCASAPAKNCTGPYYIRQENGYCCGVVSCEENFEVLICEVDYGNDTCAPCPEGSFQLDATTSVTATRCVKPNCLKNRTMPSLDKSTDIDPYACPQWCQCDLSFNYCGTDPCNCQQKTCRHGRILQQNCGCTPITPSPPKVIPVTQSNFTTSKPRINVTTESSASTVDNTSTPVSVTPFLPRTTKASDSQPKQSDDKAVAAVVAVAVVILIAFCIGWRIWKKKRSGNRNREVDGASEDPAWLPLMPGSGGGTEENINAEQPQNDIGSNRNSTAEDPDEGDPSAGDKGSGGGTEENINAEQPQNDKGSDRNSTAEDPDEGDPSAGKEST